MTYYYIWKARHLRKARTALQSVNSNNHLPYRDSKGDEQMTAWTHSLVRFTDGRVGFEAIPEEVLGALKIGYRDRLRFVRRFQPSIEPVDSSMILPEEV